LKKKRAQYAESVNEQAIFSEATRAAAAEATVKTNSEAYADSLIANIDFSYINAYIENPSFDPAGKLLNDYSIVNKLYIDKKFQQLYNTLDNYSNNTNFSIKGVHSMNRELFDSFITVIYARTTKILASFRFVPRNAQSRLNCMFNAVYDISPGAGFDDVRSYAEVFQNGVMIHRCYQQIQRFVNVGGGGTCSGCIFPLYWDVRPELINGDEIRVDIYIRNDADDNIKINDHNDNAFFTCTEILGE